MTTKRKKNSATVALEKFGIGENESILYDIMLKTGEATVLDLQKQAPFPRTLLYYILNNLMHLGLVSFIKKPRRTVYLAEDPEKLYDIVQEREREFEKSKNSLQEIIPELRNQYHLSQNRPGVRFFEGIERYREALEDVVHTRPVCIYTYLSVSERKKSGIKIREQANKDRIGWGIQEKVLLPETPEAKAYFALHKQDEKTEFRFVPDHVSIFTVDVRLYDGKITETSYGSKEPVVTMTENKELYDLQKSIFLFLWGIGKKIN